MNRKFWIVLSHTFMSHIKTKFFVISTLVAAAILILMLNFSMILSLFKEKDEMKKIGVVDPTGQVFSMYAMEVKKMHDDIDPILYEDAKQAEKDVLNGNLKAYLFIEKIEHGSIIANYYAKKITDQDFYNLVFQALKQTQLMLASQALGLSAEQIALLFEGVSLKPIALEPNAKSIEEIIQSSILINILLIALYTMVLIYGSMVAMEVAKEKSSRIMEVLISSVSPVTQMFGKIMGIFLLALFQVLIYIGVGWLSLMFGSKTLNLGSFVVRFTDFPISLLIYAIIYFLPRKFKVA